MTQIIFAILVKLSHSPMLLTTSNSRAEHPRAGASTGKMIKPRGKERENTILRKTYIFLFRAVQAVRSIFVAVRANLVNCCVDLLDFFSTVDWFFLSSSNNVARILSFFLTTPSLFAALHTATLAFYFYFLSHNYYYHRRTGHMSRNRWGNIVGSEKKTSGKNYCYMCTVVPGSLHVV